MGENLIHLVRLNDCFQIAQHLEKLSDGVEKSYLLSEKIQQI